MDELELLVKLHKNNLRQGPGSDETTKKALGFTNLKEKSGLKIADIGCGTGKSTILLAKELDAEIIAIDFLTEFLKKLESKAEELSLKGKINTLTCSMDKLPFEKEEFDVIWSEGAIYNMGFKEGIKYWKRFLKSKGILAVSEMTWLSSSIPEEIKTYWENNYSQIDKASSKIAILEDNGFKILGYFPLSESCWLENYYDILEAKSDDFLVQYSTQQAKNIIDKENEEIALYKKYKDFYSYGFYIAEKL